MLVSAIKILLVNVFFCSSDKSINFIASSTTSKVKFNKSNS